MLRSSQGSLFFHADMKLDKQISEQLYDPRKMSAKSQSIIENPACEKAKELKAELKDATTVCKCNTCSQMGLYDPAPRRRKMRGQQRLTGPVQKTADIKAT